MSRARVRVVLFGAWTATTLFLIFVAGVPAWLAFIGNFAGAIVLHNYAPALVGQTLSRGDRAVRISAYIFLGAVALCGVLLLVVTLLAFLLAWLVG
jgi:hypothetical protein